MTASLAQRINAEHQAATNKAREAIDHARRAGELLLEAKAACKHGEWLSWLKSNCSVGERQARNYIKLAKGWNAIQSKSAPGADLTIKGALRLLTADTCKTSDLQQELERFQFEWAGLQTRISELLGLVDQRHYEMDLDEARDLYHEAMALQSLVKEKTLQASRRFGELMADLCHPDSNDETKQRLSAYYSNRTADREWVDEQVAIVSKIVAEADAMLA